MYKKVKILFFAASFISLHALAQVPGTECSNLEDCEKISREASRRIEILKALKFESAFQDRATGLTWSKVLPLQFANSVDIRSCPFGYDTQETEAGRACKSVGGRLPSVKEINSLLRNFQQASYDGNGNLVLSQQGAAELMKTIGVEGGVTATGRKYVHLWTSSPTPEPTESEIHDDFMAVVCQAYGLNLTGGAGTAHFLKYVREYPSHVICVKND